MGEYYSWVNVDKKQYIEPVDFDEGPRLFSTGFSGSLYGALCALLASDWKGDHIVYIGDYAKVPENPDNETLKKFVAELRSWRSDMDFDSYIIEKCQNISGLFKAAEPMVRPEINRMIEYDDFEEYNYYRVKREDPFRGLFCRDLYFPRYVINESRKEYFDLGEDRCWYYDTRPMPIVFSYGRDASFYKYGGYWLGDQMNAKPTRELRQASYPFHEIYTQYGSLLIDLQRLEDAEAALGKAMKWNPSDAQIAFEHAETFKLRGDMESFFRLTLNIFKIAFRPKQVAHCFRNLGFYFIEKELWEEAVACFTMSLQFESESTVAMSELYYIQQKAGRTIPMPGMDKLKKYAEKYSFPVGADPDVLGMSFAYGKHFAEQGKITGARYCWQITYDLTNDEEIKQMMDKLPEDKQ